MYFATEFSNFNLNFISITPNKYFSKIMSLCCCTYVVLKYLSIFLILLKLYIKLTTRWSNSQVCLIGKTAIVTGANTGIGFETALDFAKRGARVILACRNKDKADEACQKIIEQTTNPNVCYQLIDMQSFKSVREFAKTIINTEDRLDILVNNAGGSYMPVEKTEDGHTIVYQVNHLSPFLLTNLLSDLLKKTPGSRIVNVSSLGAAQPKFDLDIFKFSNYPGHGLAYSHTKLWNLLTTKELAKRLKGQKITTYSLHPGAIATEFFRNMPLPLYLLFTYIANLFIKSCREGAQTTIHLSVAQGIEHLSGKHFHECTSVWNYFNARNEGDEKKLWEKSEELVHLKSSDPKF